MTREFLKWANKQGITIVDLSKLLDEVEAGNFEADLGGHVIKKRVRFQGQGKSGSGRTIVCFKKEDRAILIHGYAKIQKANIGKKELETYKRVAEILMCLPQDQIDNSLKRGTFVEVVENG